jgi:hypothetical protein
MSHIPTPSTSSQSTVRGVLSGRPATRTAASRRRSAPTPAASITRGSVPAVTAAAPRRPGILRRWSVVELLAGAVVPPPAAQPH